MANQYSDSGTPRDLRELDELETLPADLQPLYRRLSDDGAAWQAASAGKITTMAQSLVADIERMTGERADPSPDPSPTRGGEAESSPLPLTPSPTGRGGTTFHHRSRHVREWVAGTVAAVAIVALLALVLQGALAGHGNTGPTNTAQAGRWQILDNLTWKRVSSAQTLPTVAPSDPRVVYEATGSLSGQGGKAVTYASLRRTDDGGKTWHTLTLPLSLANISLLTVRASPLRAQTVFLSLWDRSSITCEPTSGTVGEGCERGYVSFDGGATWQTQKLPVPGILDTDGGIQAQGSIIYAQNVCNSASCVHLLSSGDNGRTWRAVDGGVTTDQRHLCDFSATASGQTVYAVASTADCSQPPDSKTLWRSDDAGATWTQVELPHKAPFNQSFTLLSNSVLTAPGAEHPFLLYLNKPYISGNAGPSFEYSEDSGATWKTTPHVPDIPSCVSPSTLCDGMLPLAIGEAAVLSDGSLFYLPLDSPNKPLTPYVWKPGAKAWQALPQLPAEVAGPGSIIVTLGANGHDTITMALRANGDASNPIAYYVVRYVM